MEIYKKTEQFIIDILEKAKNSNDIVHAKRVAYWVKKLNPKADEALLVAAIAHDIERAIYGDWKKGSDDPEVLRKHQDLSAMEIEKFLRGEKVDEKFITRVKHLVAHHEEGGDNDQNILCDADCLSFFEDKSLRRVRKWKEQGKTKAEMKQNMEHYFSRFISQKAKDIASKWYEESLREIER